METITENKKLPSGLTLEEVKALYFDDNALLEPKDRLFRIDGAGIRYYYQINSANKPVFFVSVTSLIDATLPKGFGFNSWLKNGTAEETDYKRDSRACYGTLDHIECARLGINSHYDLDVIDDLVEEYAIREGYGELKESWKIELAKSILSFAAFIEERNVEFLAIEIGLASKPLGVAGTIDYVCELDWNGGRKRAIIDKKTGDFWESHVVQLEAYKRLWEAEFPNKPIDLIMNYSSKDWRKNPTYNLKNQTSHPSRQKLDHLLGQWNIDNPVNKPKDVLTYQGVIEKGGDLSKNYRMESIEDVITKDLELWDA